MKNLTIAAVICVGFLSVPTISHSMKIPEQAISSSTVKPKKGVVRKRPIRRSSGVYSSNLRAVEVIHTPSGNIAKEIPVYKSTASAKEIGKDQAKRTVDAMSQQLSAWGDFDREMKANSAARLEALKSRKEANERWNIAFRGRRNFCMASGMAFAECNLIGQKYADAGGEITRESTYHLQVGFPARARQSSLACANLEQISQANSEPDRLNKDEYLSWRRMTSRSCVIVPEGAMVDIASVDMAKRAAHVTYERQLVWMMDIYLGQDS